MPEQVSESGMSKNPLQIQLADTNDEDDEKEEEEGFPEIWFIFDGVGTYLGQVAENNTGNFHAQITKDERNEYFDEMFTFLSPLGSDVIELSHSVAIIDVDKEEALDAITGAGFIAKKATDDDHKEIIRELDKLQTIKGGESKRYSRAKK